MARGYPTSLLKALSSKSANIAIMVRIGLRAANVNVWTGSSDITFDGETFVAAGGLIGISDIEEGALESRPVTLTFAGQGSGIYQQIKANNPKNRPVYIWLAAMNDAFTALAALDSYYMLTKVYVSRPILQDNANGWTVALECETEFARLFRPSAAFLTHNEQQKRHPGDTGLRFISTLPQADVPWGKDATGTGGGGSGAGGTNFWKSHPYVIRRRP